VIRWNDAGIWRCVVCWPPITRDNEERTASPTPAIFTALQEAALEPEPPSILARLNSGDAEWYTPKEWIDLERAVLGTIDVDPASCAQAQAVVHATTYYTRHDSGLDHYWLGTFHLNPPFGARLVQQFCGKAVEEWDAGRATAGIVVVNSATETKWFQLLMARATAVCFPHERIKFVHPTKPGKSPARGQAFFYLGPDPDRFCEVFGPHGSLQRLGGRPGETAEEAEARRHR